jgi:3D (Asp-Asp-Asp) domain-containing protein
MKSLVRGALVSSIMVLFVAFMYAQTRTESGPSSAKTSQKGLAGSFIASEVAIDNVVIDPVTNDDDKVKGKKLVEKTVSSKAAGMSRGSFSATAYCLRGRTAMGHGVRSGLIAADPRVLRLGSSVNIAGGGVNGTYLVSDTGSRIKGRRIDIWMASCSAARRFGRRTVSIN